MTETPAYTHRFVFDGHLPTMGDTRSLSTNWQKIETAFDALEKIVKDAGGTLTCVPVRNGEKKVKTIPAAPPSQSGADVQAERPLAPDVDPNGGIAKPLPSHKAPLRGAGDRDAA